MTAPKIDTQAPDRVWLKPCDPCKAPDDYYVCDPDCLDGRETEYIRASLSAAREAAAALAMREAAAKETERGWRMAGQRDGEMMRTQAAAIRDLDIPADTAALDRLIAERVREAVQPIKEAWDWWQADSYDRCASVVADAIDEAMNAARDSKEGQS